MSELLTCNCSHYSANRSASGSRTSCSRHSASFSLVDTRCSATVFITYLRCRQRLSWMQTAPVLNAEVALFGCRQRPSWMQTACVVDADGACLGGRVRPSWMQTAPLRALLTGVAHERVAHMKLLTLFSEWLSELLTCKWRTLLSEFQPCLHTCSTTVFITHRRRSRASCSASCSAAKFVLGVAYRHWSCSQALESLTGIGPTVGLRMQMMPGFGDRWM